MEDPVVIQSAVRLPTPPPPDSQWSSKRKRSPPSRSPSPDRRRSPPPSLPARTRNRQPTPPTEQQKQDAAKAEYEKLLNMRSGGTYIPPAKLRALQAQITDKSSKEYQRMAWEALKKSINGLINKVNVSNIKHIVPELFGENLMRGRGLFCRSIMKAQAASVPFTPIYAAMAAIVNTKLPRVGELLLHRLIIQFRKSYKRNDKAVCLSSTTFIAHLCNQQVAHEMLAAELLLFLLEKPTDDSVEIAVGLTKEVGQLMEERSPQASTLIFDQFRTILHEAEIDKRVQYMIEVLFQIRKDRFKDNPAVKEELDLVEEEDQITHQTGLLDTDLEVQDGLNIFKFDPDWEENEDSYRRFKAEVLGEGDSGDEDDSGSDASSDDEEAERDRAMEIKDQTNTDLTNLRRTIYLTMMSSNDFEECCHKLMKLNLPVGQEEVLTSMVIDCCAQEKTYNKFYGLIGERFSKINRLWTDLFEQAFAKYYETIHRFDTNKLRNIAQYFGHMLGTDAIGWHVFSVIHLNEQETTSSSRIFIKILFQKLLEELGMSGLKQRFGDEYLKPSFEGIFPTSNRSQMAFSINFFTACEMGAITEDLRERFKNLPKPAPPALPAAGDESDSDSSRSYSTYSSYSSSSRSRSRSRSRERGRRALRGRSLSSSRSRSPMRKRKAGRSPSESSGFDSHGTGGRYHLPHRRSRYLSSESRSRSREPSRHKNRPGNRTRRSQSTSRSRSPTSTRMVSLDRVGRPALRRQQDSAESSVSPAGRRSRRRRSSASRSNSRRRHYSSSSY